MSDLVTGHAYQPAPPDWDWGDHCTWFDTTPPVPLHPVMCHQPERSHAPRTVRDDGTSRKHQHGRNSTCPRANDTLHAAFYLIDATSAVVDRIARNENGRAYTDPATGDLAMEPPATVMLSALPPAHLRD